MQINKTWNPICDKRVTEIFNSVVQNAMDLGYLSDQYVYGPYVIRPSTRLYGQCRSNVKERCSAIGINKRVIDSNDETVITSVIVHEVAHACVPKDCHNYRWEHIGNNIGRKYNIKVHRLDNYKSVKDWECNSPIKYTIKCPGCGAEWNYRRKCACVNNPEDYVCGCGHVGLVRSL